MQKAKQRLTSLVIACVMMIACLFGAIATLVMPQTTAVAATGNYVKVTEAPTDWSGKYLIVYEAGNVAFDGSLTALDTTNNTQAVTISGSTITLDSKYSFTIAKTDAGYSIQSASGKYIGRTSNSNGFNIADSALDNTISVDASGNAIITGSAGPVLRFNKASDQMRFRYYKSGQQAIQLYKLDEGGSTCEHANQTTTTVDATCTTDGSITVTCNECGETVSTETLKATGHNYENKVCTVCGATEPNVEEKTATLDIFSTTGTLSSDKSTITWTGENVTFVNKKGSTAIRTSDSDHYRAYSGSVSTVSVSVGAIKKIVITCTAAEYTDDFDPQSGTKSSSGATITITFTEGVTDCIIKSTAQGRLNKVEVTYEVPISECEHINQTTATIPATCTENGSETVTCDDCNQVMSQKTLLATNHPNKTTTTVDATCTTDGSITVTCDDCKEIISTSVIPASHNYVDGICSVCQAKQPDQATITFDNKAKRTEFATDKQVWKENGVTVTNNKAKSTTNMGDHAAPVRFYKNSELAINYSGMAIAKIEFTCASDSYAEALQSAIGDEATANGKIVTVVLNETMTEYTITLTVGQVQVNSIEVFTTQALLNEVSAYMQLSYEYTENTDGTLSNSNFKILCGVDATLANVADVYGIKVTAGDKSVEYPWDNAESKLATDEINGIIYVVIDLGDIINDPTKLNTEFIVQACVKVGNETLYSTKTTTYSVKSMVAAYYNGEKATAETTALVAHLYTYLTKEEA